MRDRLTRREALVCGIAIFTTAAKGPITSQGVGLRGISSLGQIPRGYLTYTLFVGTSYNYAGLSAASKAAAVLSRQFKQFGDQIGPRNLAVFVGAPKSTRLDVAAGRTLLDRIKTDYNVSADYQDGPFIIVLNRHPGDKPDTSGHPSVIGFRGSSAADIQSTLAELQQEIRAAQQRQPQSPFYQLLQGLMLVWQQTQNPLAQRIAVSVAGGAKDAL